MPLHRFLLAFACGSTLLAAAPPTPVADIRALPRETLARGQPVTVRGVVTWSQPPRGTGFVVADDTAGIYVSARRAMEMNVWKGDLEMLHGLHMGAEVEVEGVTDPGGYSPTVCPITFRVVGEKPIPAARRVSTAQLLSGAEDSQRVEVEGVVESSEPGADAQERILRVGGVGGHFLVLVPAESWTEKERLVDATIRARGVALTLFNARMESTGGVRVAVARAEDLEIVEPANPDPFAAPRLDLPLLHAFRPHGSLRHRRTVEGTVIYANPGHFFYLQEGDVSVRVETPQTDPIQAGDRVTVSGFVDLRRPIASLAEAVFRKTGVARMPEPASVGPEEIISRIRSASYNGWKTFSTDYDGRLVRFEARLVDTHLQDEDAASGLLFQTGSGRIGRATLPEGANAALDAFRVGSRLRLTGVTVVDYAPGDAVPELIEPRRVDLLLRSVEDIAVIEAAPWWTAERLRYAVAAGLLLIALLAAWTQVLHRRMKAQGLALARELSERRLLEAAHQAVVKERNRLAGDLHDGVQQMISGLSMKIETARHRAAEGVNGQGHDETPLADAKKLVIRIQDEFRRCLWALREVEESEADLTRGLERLVAAQRLCSNANVTLYATGPVAPLPPPTVSALLLVCQEAIGNAIRHGGAEHVELHYEFRDCEVTLAIRDDGRGFQPRDAPGPDRGHFGLAGMRERITRLGGELDLHSEPGAGTEVRLRLPRPETAPLPGKS